MNFQALKDRWNNMSNRGRIVAFAVLTLLLALCILPFLGSGEGDNDIVVDGKDTKNQQVTYTVQSGDSIIGKIAPKFQVPWEAIAVVNEAHLAQVNDVRCNELSDRYTQSWRRQGHYCNERVVVGGKPMVNLNSLQPGDELVIPLTSHPVVDQVVTNIPGRSIAIVIDDTGSMGNDLIQVSAWYMRASGQFGKKITAVVLYADGHVRQFTNTGEVTFTTSGVLENTRNALETAAQSNPDAIVLVSDEPGDDWKDFHGLTLPPVYAHSLDGISHENLRRVATMTGGRFMRPPLGSVLANR
ncbi:MAG: LysM peptidoglycan-binding domain-containing protein [Patescibacteria group bacterium]